MLGNLPFLFLVLFVLSPVNKAQSEIMAPKAPEWEVSQWFNLQDNNQIQRKDQKSLKLADLKGRVVVIDFFQLWCPGCNNFSIPLMEKWEKKYAIQAANKKMAFVSIHTVFEGHNYQNPKRLAAYLKKKKISHPVGVDRLVKGSYIPLTMRKYKTKGTPEMAIIDKQGRIRFQKFGGFDAAKAETLIDRLLTE